MCDIDVYGRFRTVVLENVPTAVNIAKCCHFCYLISGPEQPWMWLRLSSYSHLIVKNEDDG